MFVTVGLYGLLFGQLCSPFKSSKLNRRTIELKLEKKNSVGALHELQEDSAVRCRK